MKQPTTVHVSAHVNADTQITPHVSTNEYGSARWLSVGSVDVIVRHVGDIDRLRSALDELAALIAAEAVAAAVKHLAEAKQLGEYGGDEIPTDDQLDELAVAS